VSDRAAATMRGARRSDMYSERVVGVMMSPQNSWRGSAGQGCGWPWWPVQRRKAWCSYTDRSGLPLWGRAHLDLAKAPRREADGRVVRPPA